MSYARLNNNCYSYSYAITITDNCKFNKSYINYHIKVDNDTDNREHGDKEKKYKKNDKHRDDVTKCKSCSLNNR